MTKLKILSGSTTLKITREICDNFGIEMCKVTIKTFPDKEKFVQIHDNIQGSDLFIVQSTHTPANDSIMELLLLIDAAKRSSAREITAVIPFFGYSRQDRKNQTGVPISAKLIADLLKTAGVSKILTLDLHSPQIVGFFDIPVENLSAKQIFLDYLSKYKSEDFVIFAPDLGRSKMAFNFAKEIKCPIGIISKNRKNNISEVDSFHLFGDIRNKNILLTDDIICTGNTIYSAAKILKNKGAKTIRAIVSHNNILSNSTYKKLSILDEIITTDSINLSNQKKQNQSQKNLTILPISGIFSKAIKNAYSENF